MEVTLETIEDPSKEITENNLSVKDRYEWVVTNMQT